MDLTFIICIIGSFYVENSLKLFYRYISILVKGWLILSKYVIYQLASLIIYFPRIYLKNSKKYHFIPVKRFSVAILIRINTITNPYVPIIERLMIGCSCACLVLLSTFSWLLYFVPHFNNNIKYLLRYVKYFLHFKNISFIYIQKTLHLK